MASGIGSGVAPLAENDIVFIADVRPETTVPIKIPTTRVSATNSAATAFSRLAQLTMPFTGSPISRTPVFLSAAASLELHTHPSPTYYNTRNFPELPDARVAPENALA
jgi:hypothetical protein